MPKMLNLGCGDDLRKGFINVDKFFGRAQETVGHQIKGCDLSESPWPFEDSTIDFILARDIIEHLPDKIATMNELWRVLKPGGCVHIEVPTTDGPGAFQDPTHVSYWNRHSFWYFEIANIYRNRFAESYGILAAFMTVGEQIIETPDGPKLTIILKAVK